MARSLAARVAAVAFGYGSSPRERLRAMMRAMWKWERRVLVGSLAVLSGLVLAGCGGVTEEAEGTEGGTTASPATTAKAPTAGVVTPLPAMQAFSDDGNVVELSIEGNDLMRFNTNLFQVKPGQMVRLTLKNVGILPAQSMGHNVVILKKGDSPFEFGADVNERGGSLANNYVPETLHDRVIAYTKLIGGGQTTSVTFKAPEEPGTYPFLCSFPGHAGNMNGTVEIQP